MNAHETHLVYLEEYGVVVCRACKHGITASTLLRHFGRFHTDTVPLAARAELATWMNGLLLCDPESVRVLDTIDAIPCLNITDGFECEECDKLTGTVGSMEMHCNREHGWTKVQGKVWGECKVQTFFKGLNMRFVIYQYI
jgi:hypothetical protein